MNNQQLAELSEKIRDHLTKQKARAVAEVPVVTAIGEGKEMRCRYRGDSGSMCAVGCLIPDERYSPDLEGFSAGHGMIMSAVFGPEARDAMTYKIEEKAEMLLREWQHYHDHGDYAHWCGDTTWAKSPADVHARALEAGAFEVEV